MKFLKTRQELAQYVNIKKVACVSIDISKVTEDEWRYCEGDRVKCGFNTLNYGELTTHGNVYVEKGEWYISGNGVCIHSGTTIYTQEALETMKWANTPTVREGDEIVVIAYNGDMAIPMVMEVGKVNPHCMTACQLH